MPFLALCKDKERSLVRPGKGCVLQKQLLRWSLRCMIFIRDQHYEGREADGEDERTELCCRPGKTSIYPVATKENLVPTRMSTSD